MFPLLIVLIFSLFQSLNADGGEFPKLSQKISVKWDNVYIPAEKLDFRLTTNFDGVVPYLIFCGPFKAGGNGGECEWTLNYGFRSDGGSYTMGSGKGETKNLFKVDDNVSCMRIYNPLPDFPRLYKDATESYGTLDIDYTCKTKVLSNNQTALLVFAIIFLCAIVVGAFYFGKKKGIQKNAQENAYGAYAGKIPNNMPANPSLGSPLC